MFPTLQVAYFDALYRSFDGKRHPPWCLFFKKRNLGDTLHCAMGTLDSLELLSLFGDPAIIESQGTTSHLMNAALAMGMLGVWFQQFASTFLSLQKTESSTEGAASMLEACAAIGVSIPSHPLFLP